MKLVILDAKTYGSDVALDPLGQGFDVACYANTPLPTLAERIADAEIIVTNKVPLREASLAAAPKLKLIAVAATGVDIIDLAAAQARGVAVCNVPGYGTASVAAHCFALYFQLAHGLVYHHHYATTRWSASDCFTHLDRPWREPTGQTWGIVGLGAIGRAVADRAHAFGFRVVYSSTSGKHHDPSWPELSLKDLLEQADVVSLHAPLTEATRGLIAAPQLARMKQDALLINTSRGALIEERDLAEALTRGQIAGAALDVLSSEPPPQDHPLLTRDFGGRLLLTPHIAGLSAQSRQRLLTEVRANMDAFLAGQDRNLCPAQVPT